MMNRLGIAALICAAAGIFTTAPAQPAHAQGFFERLFGPPSYGRNSGRSYRYDDRGRWRSYRNESPVYDSRRASRANNYDPEPVRVKGPTYYTYRADALKTVSFASLAEVEIASNAPLDAAGDPAAFVEARAHLASYSLRVYPEVGEAIKTHYTRHPGFLWVEAGMINTRAREALAALKRAGQFGLSVHDYKVEEPYLLAGSSNMNASAKALVEFEIALSAKVLTYVLDATRGRIDPNRISGYHDFERKTVDLTAALMEISQAGDAGAYLDARNPSNKPFKALMSELARLQSVAPVERVEIAAGTFVRPGGAHPEIANVVAAIRIAGSDKLKQDHAAALSGYAASAQYTPELVALVRDFQAEKGLKPDGIIGRNTIKAMQPETGIDKRSKVELAMERLRWLPRELGQRHVMINQPAFTATYSQEGGDPLTMRVVVGKKSNQTNFFMDKIRIVEFNPYWGVPHSIIVNEMVPQLYNDPSYLDRLGYEVTTASGQQVSSYDVDWQGVAANAVPINVRQPPGEGNALGLVKILFPNKHHIYMHDTPQKSLFSQDTRAFSHGCVRLQDPRAMAAAVLGKPVSYIDQRIGEGQNAQEKVTADIPVYVAYFTAWPNAQGQVEYFDDIYDRDMYLSRAISTTDAARAGS